MTKGFIKFLLIVLSFVAIERFCHKQTHGFRIHKIQSDLSFNKQWEIPPLDTETKNHIQTILSQPYYFLGSGGQCYAFVSKDRKYVLKVFKQHHMRKKHWLDRIIPFKAFREKYLKRRLEKFDRLFTSCKIAYDHFKENTALLYIHLNKTKDLDMRLKFYDAIGVVHELDLDALEFTLQKKASMAFPTLTALLENHQIEEAKLRLQSLLDLIFKRSQLGIADHDPRRRNFGFIDKKAVEIDLGSFTIEEPLKRENEGKRAFFFETMKLRRWVQKNHPELSEFLEENIQIRLNDTYQQEVKKDGRRAS